MADVWSGRKKLYACQNGRKRIVAYDTDGKENVIAEDLESNDLAITHKGEIYVSDPGNKKVWFINAAGVA
jgi:gluconolactonase